MILRCAFAALLLLAGATPIALGASPSPDCEDSLENKACTVTISRNNPVTPLPYRVRKNSGSVTIEVGRNPLEKVTFEESVALVAEPDVLASLAGRLIDPLKTLVVHTSAIPLNAMIPSVGNPGRVGCRLPELREYCLRVEALRRERDQIADQLTGWKANADGIPATIGAIRKISWSSNGSHVDTAVLKATSNLIELLGCAKAADASKGEFGCSNAAPPERCSDRARLATCQMPAEDLAIFVSGVGLLQALIAADPDARRQPNYPAVLQGLTDLQPDTITLTADLNRLQSLQGELKVVRDSLQSMEQSDFSPVASKVLAAQSKTSTSTVKIAAVDAVSKKSTALPTITLNWVRMPWEVSVGAWYSALGKRSYSVAPVIENGQPVMDGTTARKVLRETTSSPNVVPGAFIHYRVVEREGWHGKRVAILATFAAGVANGATEFGVGPSFAWGNLTISPMIHFGRDVDLADGLTVGQVNPPDISGSQRRVWTHRFGIGISVKAPF